MAAILPDTSIAAGNDGAHINVYFQQTDGSLVEHTWRSRKDGKWKWQASSVLPLAGGVAKVFTPLAANAVVGDDSTGWHLYYLDAANQLCEVYHNGTGSWTQGSLDSMKYTAAPFSRLAYFSDTLFYQSGSGWTQSAQPMTTHAPLLGTSLAAAVADVVIDQSSRCSVESTSNSGFVSVADCWNTNTTNLASHPPPYD